MKPEELQAVRERYENATRGYLESSVIESHQDVPKLLAEIERLRPHNLVTQVDELLKLGVDMRREIARLKQDLSDKDAELQTYRVQTAVELADKDQEIERLRGALDIPKPDVYPDGDQWCALHGENLQVGIAGFGDTIEDAYAEYVSNWTRQALAGDSTPKGGVPGCTPQPM